MFSFGCPIALNKAFDSKLNEIYQDQETPEEWGGEQQLQHCDTKLDIPIVINGNSSSEKVRKKFSDC